MYSNQVKTLYLDNVTFNDEGEGCFHSERSKSTGTYFYTFNVSVSQTQFMRVKYETEAKLKSLKSFKKSEFEVDESLNQCMEQQWVAAYREKFGRSPIYNNDTGTFNDYLPRVCCLSCDELMTVYFRQLDPPIVNGAEHGDNIKGRTGNIAYHLNVYDDGQIHATCSYINLDPIEEEEYVESGLTDDGLF